MKAFISSVTLMYHSRKLITRILRGGRFNMGNYHEYNSSGDNSLGGNCPDTILTVLHLFFIYCQKSCQKCLKICKTGRKQTVKKISEIMEAILFPYKVSVVTELFLFNPFNISFFILFILLPFLLNQIVLF